MTEQFEDDDNRQVILMGQTFLYRQKAPFVSSGLSVKGALEYDAASDRVKCHECGKWFSNLASHVFYAHQIMSRDYKVQHGLRLQSGLIAEGLRAERIEVGKRLHLEKRFTGFSPIAMERSKKATKDRMAKGGNRQTAERRNEDGRCHAQLMSRFKSLMESLGRTPSKGDMRAAGISPSSFMMAFNVETLNQAISLMGADCNPQPGANKYSKIALTEMLIDFFVKHGRAPSSSDFRRKLLPAQTTYVRYFGSMKASLLAAGLMQHVNKRQAARYCSPDSEAPKRQQPI